MHPDAALSRRCRGESRAEQQPLLAGLGPGPPPAPSDTTGAAAGDFPRPPPLPRTPTPAPLPLPDPASRESSPTNRERCPGAQAPPLGPSGRQAAAGRGAGCRGREREHRRGSGSRCRRGSQREAVSVGACALGAPWPCVVGGGPGLLVGPRVGPCLAAQGELPAAWGRPHVSLTVFSCPVAC